ncbi:MAG: hypothetical protein ABIB11_00065 [Candidatus Omnitrophota bacterium]
MARYRRKRYIVKKDFQIKYTAMIMFFILLTVFIAYMVIYFSVFPFLSEKLANVYPQGRLYSILRSANNKVLFASILFLPIAAWFGIVLSHRIAGPWYKLENILYNLASGHYTEEVKLRKGDEFHSLAEAVNNVARSLKAMAKEDVGYINVLDDKLRSLHAELDREQVDIAKTKSLISEIQVTSESLKSVIRRYKLMPEV